MKSNYTEIKDFVELGLTLGCDRIVFQKIFGYADIRENINFTNNKKIFSEIADILADPIFSHPRVDTTVIDSYRKYRGKKVFFLNGLISKGQEWLFYLPIKALFWHARYFSWLKHLVEFWKRKRIPRHPKGRHRSQIRK